MGETIHISLSFCFAGSPCSSQAWGHIIPVSACFHVIFSGSVCKRPSLKNTRHLIKAHPHLNLIISAMTQFPSKVTFTGSYYLTEGTQFTPQYSLLLQRLLHTFLHLSGPLNFISPFFSLSLILILSNLTPSFDPGKLLLPPFLQLVPCRPLDNSVGVAPATAPTDLLAYKYFLLGKAALYPLCSSQGPLVTCPSKQVLLFPTSQSPVTL